MVLAFLKDRWKMFEWEAYIPILLRGIFQSKDGERREDPHHFGSPHRQLNGANGCLSKALHQLLPVGKVS